MNRLHKIISHMNPEPARMNPAVNPEAPKTCEDCKETKPVTEFRKYPRGINYDVKCLDCRKTVNKKKRDDKKLNPPPPIQVEPPLKRGRPKKVKEEIKEVKQEVEEEVKEVKEKHRICNSCGEEKELTGEFFHRKKEDWFRECKLCRNTKRNELYRTSEHCRRTKANYQKLYAPQYYANNKERLKEYHKAYRDRTKEERRIQRELKKQNEELKKQEEMQKLIREEAIKLLQNGGLEMLN